MFNSIFRKQFIFFLGTVIISFVIFAAVMSQAFRSYYVSQKETMLETQCKRISALVSQYYLHGGGGVFSITFDMLDSQIAIIHDFLDFSFLFVLADSNKIEITTIDISSFLSTTLDLPDLSSVYNGQTVTLQGKLNNIFDSTMLTVAYPVTMQGVIIGAAILNTPMAELQQTISDVVAIMFMCLLAGASIAFVLIYISSRTISKPLKQMNDAAKIIAGGNFEKRLHINQRDEIGQLGQSFNNMAESLYQQDRLRQEFITNMSHDIRTPLTSMRGFIEAILDGTIPPEKQEHYLNIVLDETVRLSKLANDVLDLNKIQQLDITLDRTDFDINELIRATVLMFETRVRDKYIALSLDLADEVNIVNADREKITRVLFNLLDNALKFTHDGGKVSIKTVQHGEKLYISVSDNGPGIDPNDQKWIFERFFKADASRGADKNGSGLGLAIVKAFIIAHNESITLDSTPGQGTVFTFSLPINK